MIVGLAMHLLISIVAVVGHELCRVSEFDGNWHVEYRNVFFLLFTCVGIGQLIPLLTGICGITVLRVLVIFTKPPSREAEVEMMTIIARSKRYLLGLPGLLVLMSSFVFLWPALRSIQ
jgi:hypothetical protein